MGHNCTSPPPHPQGGRGQVKPAFQPHGRSTGQRSPFPCPAHLTKAAYGELSSYIVSHVGGGESGRPFTRPRLESIIPANAAGGCGRGVRGNFSIPLWVTGQAGRVITPRRRGRGRYAWHRGAAGASDGGERIQNLCGGGIQKPAHGHYIGGHLGRGRGRGHWQ